MVLVNITAAAMLSAHFYPDALEKVNIASQKEVLEYDRIHGTEFAKDWDLAVSIEAFKEEMNFDPVQLFGWMPSPILYFCVAFSWLAILSLAFYVWNLLWSSIRVAFGPSRPSSSHTPASSKMHAV